MWGMWTQPEHQQQESKLPPLEDYQKEAIDFISFNWRKNINTLCTLGVGMGKTRIACEIIARLFECNAPLRLQGYALVCCPTTGLRDTIWKETLERYKQRIMILEGEQFDRIKLKTKKTLSIPPLTTCLITYANLCREDNIDYFYNNSPNLIVFDEYHTLTNNSQKKEQQYRNTVMKLPLRLRIGLTATPFVNSEMESVIAYGLLNDTKIIEEFWSTDTEGRRLLLQMVKEKRFLFYKNNPYTLTPASEWIISIPMGREHYSQYLKIRKDYEDDRMSSAHKIGKITVSPALLDKKERAGLNPKIETGKIIALKSIVSHLPDGDKIVIFDNYKETLKYIMRLDFIRPLKPVLYTGGVSKSDNRTRMDKFINESDYRVLLTTRQEGGEGLNLQTANHLVMLNCWWTVKDIIQMLGRIKRKGQKKPVYAYILGYNLFDCLEPGKTPDAYILPEDSEFYGAVRRKKEMCENWGIEVETKLPLLKAFLNYNTFESKFNDFLEQTIIRKPLKITSKELQEEINASNEKYNKEKRKTDDFIKGEMQAGETLLQNLYSFYRNDMKNNPKNHGRKKIIVVKKKNYSPAPPSNDEVQ